MDRDGGAPVGLRHNVGRLAEGERAVVVHNGECETALPLRRAASEVAQLHHHGLVTLDPRVCGSRDVERLTEFAVAKGQGACGQRVIAA